ncbi:threonylcarbamoyl-AMP synthase [Erythrobacter sp. 3-20A1M]|uniref:L-threonylcarbamoyladenylate synthase n=1 Tax=Erythrobacter sp. 3-20A1M TaxID=2653850 RepID=UPI001BFC5B46|nr:L-threonylcarbamoyladenylate synthase [Erythrobacter sp. 3-20A1M]QWC56812.1 threonylcarbamoyl-AMP synthase [Erythrobacter sp. 3-20A1M]
MGGKNATETLSADDAGITRAVEVLRDRGLVAVPTETVYGLAARADSDAAVARIYAAKGRPSFNPLIVHVRDEAQARDYAEFVADADLVSDIMWPGPLTLVLPRRPDAGLAAAVTAELDTVALRCPDHPVMRALLAQCDFPLAAPSANRSGFISPTTAEHVVASLGGRIDLVLDAGPCRAGVESTIMAIREDGRWEELRAGPVDLQALHDHYYEDTGKLRPVTRGGGTIESPGQLASHYAPGKPVRLNAEKVAPDEFFIGFGAIEGQCNLSAAGDLAEAASRLYACLYHGAHSDCPRIAVAPIPNRGIGRAINDRLRRAAAPVETQSGS